jgi:hypothetical protein
MTRAVFLKFLRVSQHRQLWKYHENMSQNGFKFDPTMRISKMSPESRKVVARNAAICRWIRVRFGASDFESIGLPGGAAVDAGLADLAAGRESIESLVVSVAAPRLKREGVPMPRDLFPNAEMRLYRLLERTGGDLAHARYLAWLRQAAGVWTFQMRFERVGEFARPQLFE